MIGPGEYWKWFDTMKSSELRSILSKLPDDTEVSINELIVDGNRVMGQYMLDKRNIMIECRNAFNHVHFVDANSLDEARSKIVSMLNLGLYRDFRAYEVDGDECIKIFNCRFSVELS